MNTNKDKIRNAVEALRTERALKLALEALEDHGHPWPQIHHESRYAETITAIREALAEQPAQQCNECESCKRKDTLLEMSLATIEALREQPAPAPKVREQQQPVAWMYDIARYGPDDLRGQQWRPAISRIQPHIHDRLVRDIIPLYTSPQPIKPWVGLTGEDILRIKGQFKGTLDVQFDKFAYAIEAKLKAKNSP